MNENIDYHRMVLEVDNTIHQVSRDYEAALGF